MQDENANANDESGRNNLTFDNPEERTEFWMAVVQEQLESGLSAYAFCKQQDLSPSSFHHWKQKLKKQSKADDESETHGLSDEIIVPKNKTEFHRFNAYPQQEAECMILRAVRVEEDPQKELPIVKFVDIRFNAMPLLKEVAHRFDVLTDDIAAQRRGVKKYNAYPKNMRLFLIVWKHPDRGLFGEALREDSDIRDIASVNQFIMPRLLYIELRFIAAID